LFTVLGIAIALSVWSLVLRNAFPSKESQPPITTSDAVVLETKIKAVQPGDIAVVIHRGHTIPPQLLQVLAVEGNPAELVKYKDLQTGEISRSEATDVLARYVKNGNDDLVVIQKEFVQAFYASTAMEARKFERR
jgi:hypothetical protein